MDYIRILLTYLCDTSESLTMDDVEKKLLPLLDEKKGGEIMTLAERLIQKGKIEGKIEGIEGEIALCENLLQNELLHPQLADHLKTKMVELEEKLKNMPGAAHMPM